MTTFTKDIPIPDATERSGRTPKYKFAGLEAKGWSYFEPTHNQDEVKRIQRAAASFSRRTGVKLVTRFRNEHDATGALVVGVRIWRTS